MPPVIILAPFPTREINEGVPYAPQRRPWPGGCPGDNLLAADNDAGDGDLHHGVFLAGAVGEEDLNELPFYC